MAKEKEYTLDKRISVILDKMNTQSQTQMAKEREDTLDKRISAILDKMNAQC